MTDALTTPSPPLAPLAPRSRLLDVVFPLLLTLATSILAFTLWSLGTASAIESVAFVSGAVCVWLTVRESIWNFPVSLLNVATFAVVFFRVRLFADAGLQVVYFILTLIGWYLWLYGGRDRTALRISRVPRTELLLITVAGALLTLALWQLLQRVGGSASFFDALTTSLSLCAQWLLNKKRLENWLFWITADLVYIPLYAYKQLYLTSALYAVFLCMCLIGIRQWHSTWRAQSHAEAVP